MNLLPGIRVIFRKHHYGTGRQYYIIHWICWAARISIHHIKKTPASRIKFMSKGDVLYPSNWWHHRELRKARTIYCRLLHYQADICELFIASTTSRKKSCHRHKISEESKRFALKWKPYMIPKYRRDEILLINNLAGWIINLARSLFMSSRNRYYTIFYNLEIT